MRNYALAVVLMLGSQLAGAQELLITTQRMQVETALTIAQAGSNAVLDDLELAR